MKRALTADEMREADRAASASHGMPAAVLMENAGEALAQAALEAAAPGGRFFALCGVGNNGGDGLVAARKLRGAGRTVFVELVGAIDRLTPEAERNLVALRGVGLSPKPFGAQHDAGRGDVVLDAVFGTGLNRAPEGGHADALERINALRAAGARVVAADLPSGLHSDSGRPFVPCVQADVTVAFSHPKLGCVLEPGASFCGTLKVADIGIPDGALMGLRPTGVFLVEESDVRARLPPRKPDTHKGTYGHVLVVAGSWGKSGAAALAGLGALRGGAGLVTVATRPEALVPVLAHAPELMGVELISDGGLGLADLNSLLEAAEGKQAVVMGPGIPRGPETARLLGALLEETSVPCVLDADALNAVAERPGLLGQAKGPVILTPHPGEMARLSGRSTAEVQLDRVGSGRTFAQRYAVTVVLKGARTLVCLPDGTVHVNPTGNPGMATAGTGDVLAGLTGGLLAQGLLPEDASLTACFAHGLAGDLWAAAHTGRMGLVASDLLAGLGEVWRRWER